MKHLTKSVMRLTCAAAIAALCSGAALADDDSDDGAENKFTISANAGITTDYVFRGISQNGNDVAPQGGVDVGYGMFYAGVWASKLDFGQGPTGTNVANSEVDFYAGITPKLGPVDLDLGLIYYAYPGAIDAGAELDFWELKAAGSTTFAEIIGVGATVYYTPEYTGKTGTVWTLEGNASVTMPTVAGIVPSVSATVGTSISDNDPQFVTAFNGKDYVYWNAGLTLDVDKLSFDFRYHDTDISDANGFCSGPTFHCNKRFSFTGKITF